MIEATTATTMPVSTPRATTAAAVSSATANSWRRTARMRRIPRMSMSSAAIRKTTAARAAIGMEVRGPVSVSRTASTTAVVVSEASWLRPPALSTIWVLVGLPLTTKVPGDCGDDVRGAQRDQVGLLAEGLLVPHGVGA